nr:outer membrane beta-barrel protein [Chitinophaga sedimenti]
MKKKATLKFNVTDIFASNRFRGFAEYGNVYLRVNNRWQNRTGNLSFTYRFGNNKVQGARERKTGSEEEANRAG